ncbi:zinc finger MYM-type protein 1-like [Capsicum annuum]
MTSSSQCSVKNFFTVLPKSNLVSDIDIQSNQESNANHSKVALPSQENAEEFDLSSLKFDPGERIPILKYPSKHRDLIRRAYLLNGPYQSRLQLNEYPQTDISGSMRRFNHEWFDDVYHDWLEYNVSKDAAYCLYCYLFKDNNIHQGGGEVFSTTGFKSWNKKKGLEKHIGLPNSHGYWIRVNASVDVARLLITQGFAFQGHDESKTSLSRGNFLQILSWYAKKCDKIHAYVLEHAPQNDQMTAPSIQKDIVSACKIEIVKAILEELHGDYFSLLVDESFDVSRTEQMTIVFRYVDRMGFVIERLIDVIHVQDTSALSVQFTCSTFLESIICA